MSNRKWEWYLEGRPGHKRVVLPSGKLSWESVLSHNSRPGHWGEQRRVKEHDEGMVAMAVRSFRPPAPLTKAKVLIVMHWHGRHRRDPDNMGGLMKGVLDGLVSGGVLADDSFDVIREYGIGMAPTQQGESEFYHILVEDMS